MQVVNFPQGVKDELYKLASINLCPNTSGQIAIAVIMNPPKPGDPSYPLWAEERDAILQVGAGLDCDGCMDCPPACLPAGRPCVAITSRTDLLLGEPLVNPSPLTRHLPALPPHPPPYPSPPLQSLKRRAHLVVSTFNSLEGVSCTEVEGALYAFPRLSLPAAALAAAQAKGKPADFEYCWELLEETGIVTVPGSGFGQEPGTLHLRTTILPPERDMQEVSERVTAFHNKYLGGWK